MDRHRSFLLLMVLLAVLALVGVALAGSGATIDWDVIAGGGAPASGVPPSGGTITLNDTLGQPVTGSSSGGNIDLSAGYWTGLTVEGEVHIYLPLILR